MEVGDIVEHKCKESTSGYPHDKKYVYLAKCRMKNPTNGEWVDGLIYAHEGNIYVRERTDFEDKFKVVEDGGKD